MFLRPAGSRPASRSSTCAAIWPGSSFPPFIGWVRERTGSFDGPVFAIAGLSLLAAGAVALLRVRRAAAARECDAHQPALWPVDRTTVTHAARALPNIRSPPWERSCRILRLPTRRARRIRSRRRTRHSTATHAVFADLARAMPGRAQHRVRWLLGRDRYQDIHDILMQPDLYITSVRNVVPGSSTTGRRPPLHLDPPRSHAVSQGHRSRARAPRASPASKARRAAWRVHSCSRSWRCGEADFVEHFSSPLPAARFRRVAGTHRAADRRCCGARRRPT